MRARGPCQISLWCGEASAGSATGDPSVPELAEGAKSRTKPHHWIYLGTVFWVIAAWKLIRFLHFNHPLSMAFDEATNPDKNPTFTKGDLTVAGSDLIYRRQKISLTEVIAIKYGWLPIRLDMYTIGGRYKIELRTANHTVKLNFRSYFGLFKKRQEENFYAILDAIWDMTVVRLLNTMIDDIDAGKSVSIGKCVIDSDGISYNGFLIRWDDLLYQKNYNKLTLNSKSDPSVWTNLYYAETDNVHILMYYLEWKFENGS